MNALTTWAATRSSPALELFGRTLDDHGADDTDPGYVCHEPMSTPERVRGLLESAGFDAVRARWTGLATLGRQVSVDGVTGVALGLDDDGALLVATESGTVRVVAGDVVELG